MTKLKDKTEFYVDYIAPYKGKIEAWYVENKSLFLYFKLIIMTIYVVLFPHNKINYAKKFKSFPVPPRELVNVL